MAGLISDVAAFHQKFRHFIAEKLHHVGEVDYQTRKFRMDRIEEEAKELVDAIRLGKVHKVAREAVDLIYVVIGTLLIFGIPLEPIWRAVHRANMAKEFAGYLEKPTKPEDWRSPDEEIANILNERFAEQADAADEEAERLQAEADKATPPDDKDKGSESGAPALS